MQLSAQDLEAVPEAVQSVLEWLDRIATALMNHRTTEEMLCENQEPRMANPVSLLQSKRPTMGRWNADIPQLLSLESRLLDACWNSSLHQRLREVASQGSADTVRRQPYPLQQL